MKRNIVSIDRDKCTGCGLCIDACHEGALQLVNGKAQLVSEAYCDGLGACLPKCPVDAIAIVEREADAFDDAAVLAAATKPAAPAAVPFKPHGVMPSGCPGTLARALAGRSAQPAPSVPPTAAPAAASELRQWPCQLKLVPVSAPYFDGAELLVAADCSAFACATVHRDFMRGRITLIGCPKLDGVDYAEKLGAILSSHDIRSVTVLRMEVPCCGGLADAARRAVAACGKPVPFAVVTLTTEGGLAPATP